MITITDISTKAYDRRTWIYAQGNKQELEALRVEARARWPRGLEIRPPRRFSAKDISVYQMTLAFKDPRDAALFRLSY